MGFTAIIVGQLNLISVAFLCFIYWSIVDYGIQIYSRILEDENNSEKNF